MTARDPAPPTNPNEASTTRTVSTVPAAALAAASAALEGRCPVCLRGEATDEDWHTYAEGEGHHLCWAPGAGSCHQAPEDGVSVVSLALAAALPYLRTQSDVLAGELADKAQSAARLVSNAAQMLDHLVMDTLEDQEVTRKVTAALRQSAAAITAGVSDLTPAPTVEVPRG